MHPSHLSGRRRLMLLGLSAALVAGTLAATSVSTATAAPAERRSHVERHDETGKVGFIGTARGQAIDSGQPAGTPAADVATSFLRDRAGQLGLDADRTGLAVREQHATAGGGRAVRVQQEYAGIPVLGGQFTVNLDDSGDVLSVLGEASPIAKARTRPSVDAAAAARTAVAAVAKGEGLSSDGLKAAKPELVLYDPRLLGAPGPFQEARLSWVTEVTGEALAHTVVVDAVLGNVALEFSSLAHAKDRIVCDAGSTAGQYPCTTPVWTEASQPANGNPDVQAAFDYAGDTYDFFFDRFGRDSLDGAGMQLVSTVDYCPDAGNCPFANAFWDGTQMVYGDGFAVADDVVGHELAHGFTDFSSSLFYYSQSGAINEAMSDIFGEFIDLTNTGGNDDPSVRWEVGEDVPGFGTIRDMQHPPNFSQPDRMQSPEYTGDLGEGDSGGVHTNSGVANKAAYLLADGDTFNGQTVGAIGIDKTALLFYTVNNDMLVSGSDYADLASALDQACTNLIGTGGITATDCTQVDRAIAATEMTQNPMNAPTFDAPICATEVPTPVYFDDLETDTNQFTTGAVSGENPWFYPQNTNPYGFDATYATSGDTNIWGYDIEALSDSFVRMTDPVTVPADGVLHFKHSYGFEDSGDFYDGGVLEYSTTGAAGPWTDAGALMSGGQSANGYTGTISTGSDNPLGGRQAFVGESNGYGATRVDLASLAGDSVMFRWRLGADSSVWDYGWFIDDITIASCGDTPPPDTTAPQTTITGGPAEGSTIETTSATFSFTANEAGSTFQCSLDGAAYGSCTSPKALTGLSEGGHTFRVRATDTAGNTDTTPASRTFTVDLEDTPPPDTTAPQTTITGGPAQGSTIETTSATFSFTANETGSTFQCSLDGAAYGSCTSPKALTGLSEGGHTFRVRATDTAGNTDTTPASRTFTVDLEDTTPPDTTAPDTTITKGPDKKTKKRKAKFTFVSSEAGSSFECKLDKGKWKACTSPKKVKVKPGKHKFQVRATDAAGNTDGSPAKWKWKMKKKRRR